MTLQTPCDKRIVTWLLTGCFLIAAMVVVGGITRLTGSGLSITQWKLIHGTLPPLTHEAWQEEFDNYRQIPQFRHINYNFTLADFKGIYWWEYIHRLLGRMIGLVFLVPFAWFYVTGRLRVGLVRPLLFLFFLGGLQGFLGWYMVKSGLSDNLYVSHIRLAVHLMAATATYAVTLLIALNCRYGVRVDDDRMRRRYAGFGFGLLALVVVQMVFGAFVAGLKAGFVFNTFPTMDGFWVPPAVADGLAGPLADWTGDRAVVQFIHRWLAGTVLVAVFLFSWVVRRDAGLGSLSVRQWHGAMAVTASVVLQFLLGVFTLVSRVPVVLGVLHQLGALAVVTAVVLFLHSLYRDRQEAPARWTGRGFEAV